MQAVILAGGLGTRLKPFTDNMPKPMIEIGNRPFLEYLINQVKSFGISEILILLGYLPDKIVEYFGDGSKWGVHISYDITPIEFDTGARLFAAKNKIKGDFLLLYCDNYCPLNFDRATQQFYNSGASIQLTAYSNKDQYTTNNLLVGQDGLVKIYDKQRQLTGLNAVDIGYAIIKHDILSFIPDENISFEKEVYPRLSSESKLSALVTHHRYVSIGSWQRLEITKDFFAPKKVVFLDRDGTINKRAPKACYIDCPDNFIWLPGSRQAIKKLNDAGYILILITNQPGISRQMLTYESLNAIHAKMQKELTSIGARIDKIYYCPHGWDEECDCRKPKPGMLFSAQRDYNINLQNAVFFGDDERDMEAAMVADVKGILLSENYSLLDAVDDLLRTLY